MPELPEVEIIKLQLEKRIIGKKISQIESFHKKSLIGEPTLVVGKKIIGVKRIGKMIVIDLEGEMDIGIHLKMSGQLIYKSAKLKAQNSKSAQQDVGIHKHTRVVITFSDGDQLLFNDQRIFGWVRIMHNAELVMLNYVKNLGKEPWDITDQEFYNKIKNKNRPIKIVILDQEIISGVGNIYANDALWEAGVRPDKPAKKLRYEDIRILRKAIVKVLREGIKYGGTTAGDGKYVNLEGESGGYQNHVRVYDRKGEKCSRNDGGVIEKITLGGRGTYFCPICQK